jgi:signal transduction histidine kinase
MQILIQDLLTLSRITSRAQPFETCNLNEILTGVLSDLEVAIERQGARVQVGALPVIEADPLQIRQLFQNLISNGLKFHQPGTPSAVSISGRLIEPEVASVAGRKAPEATCEIVVQDEGIGFDPKFAEQIFVVFQRLHTRSEFEGTGIGLAVCRKITDRHGGTIVATSEEGHGARFIITLPVKQSSAQT